MSLLDSVLRPRALPPDDPLDASLFGMWADLEPDALFVRRLRSEAVNRFVSVREGTAAPAIDAAVVPAMGRLGRACLFASVALASTAASVLAASQAALPGDPLYGLKLRIEQVRLDALPAHLHDELDAYALAERIDEMGRLTAAGRWDEAIALTPAIEEAYERVLERDGQGAVAAARIERHLVVLHGLIARLPEGARAAVQGVVDHMNETQSAGDGAAPQAAPPANANAGGGGPNAGGPTDPPSLEASGQADGAASPERTPRPVRTPKPAPEVAPPDPMDGGPKDDAGD